MWYFIEVMSAGKKTLKLQDLKSKKAFEAALKMMLESDFAPPVPDASIEDFLSIPKPPMKKETARQLTPETKERLYKVAQEPPQEAEQKLELGGIIQARRERAKLSRERIALVLGKTPDFIERFESGVLPPWRLGPTVAAKIMILFDLGFNEYIRAMKNSFAVNEGRKKLKRGKHADVSAAPYYKNPSVKRAIDIISMRGATDIEFPEKINDWLKSLRKELERREAAYLLEK